MGTDSELERRPVVPRVVQVETIGYRLAQVVMAVRGGRGVEGWVARSWSTSMVWSNWKRRKAGLERRRNEQKRDF